MLMDDLNDTKKDINKKPVKPRKKSKKGEDKSFKNVPTTKTPDLTVLNDEAKPLQRGTKLEFAVRHLVEGKVFPEMPYGIRDFPFPIFCYKEKNSRGQKRIIELDHDSMLATELTPLELGDFVDEYVGFAFASNEMNQAYSFLAEKSDLLTKKYIKRMKPIDAWPMPIGFKSDPGYFFERHSFDPIKGSDFDDFPTIAKFLRKTENFVGLCQIIGSILAGKPIRKLSPLLWGDAGTGKSTFFQILKRIFGEKASAEVPEAFGKDKFATKFVENTAAWFADDIRSDFINCNEFKKISGGDTFPVRAIGRDYVDVKIYGVFFLSANDEYLDIRNQKALTQERLLSCKVTGVIDHADRVSIDDFFREVDKELPYFCGYCMDVFETHGHVVQKADESKLVTEVIGDAENDLEAIFDTYLALDDKHVGEKTSIVNKTWTRIWENICRYNPSFSRSFKRKDFNDFVARKLGRKKPMVPFRDKNGEVKKGVTGLREKKLIFDDLKTN